MTLFLSWNQLNRFLQDWFCSFYITSLKASMYKSISIHFCFLLFDGGEFLTFWFFFVLTLLVSWYCGGRCKERVYKYRLSELFHFDFWLHYWKVELKLDRYMVYNCTQNAHTCRCVEFWTFSGSIFRMCRLTNNNE